MGGWFESYGNRFWNGEYYDVPEIGARLFPVQQPCEWDDDTREPTAWEITGWELR